MATTTDLYKLGQGGWKFTWGELIRIHNISERYAIVEYYCNEFKNGYATGAVNYNDIRFHTYIDGISTNNSYHSLDEALIGLVCHANFDPNTAMHASGLIAKMIGLKKNENN